MATNNQSDPLFWNKVVGAVLFGGLIAMACGFAAELLVHPHKLEKNVYVVAVPEAKEAAGAGAPKAIEPIAPLLASADPKKGESDAKKCAACHTFTKGGPARVGPNLWNVVGGPHAHMQGFAYSQAMEAQHGKAWDYEALNHFLANPRSYIAGTKMTFAGISSAKERADVIAFLRSLSDSPKPLP